MVNISAGDAHCLFLKNNGMVWATGGNAFGRLGDGTTESRYNAVQVLKSADIPLNEIKAISAGTLHSLFLTENGSVWSVGINGQLGDGTTTDRIYPAQISNLNGVTNIDAGTDHSIF